MNRCFLFLCFLFFANSVFSQCYEPIRNDGISFYNQAQYTNALNCFMAAQRCQDKPANHDLSKWIADCNAKLNAAPAPKAETPKQNTTTTASQSCYVSTLKVAQASFSSNNFADAKELFLEARKCADLPRDNELILWIKICDDELDFLECIKENYTPFYLKGNEFFRRANFEKAKENYILASKSRCVPADQDVYEKIKACDQKIKETRFNTLLYDTIPATLWGKEGVFTGFVQYNKPNGKGVFLFSKDQSFSSIEADFQNGEPVGMVHCIFNNQDEFRGTLNGNHFEIGAYKYANGDIYEGSFVQWSPNGNGIFRYINGDIYTGKVVNGKKEGVGKLVIKSGNYIPNAQGATTYEGEWAANQKSGFGKCYDDKGALIHEGVFTRDFPEKDYPNRVMRISFTWVTVPAGTFRMGCTDIRDCTNRDRPSRAVTLSEFQISDKEITVGQYRVFCTATGRNMPPRPSWGWEDNDPIVNVSWNDAVAFCQWTNCRLPTEAEWEHAAQGAKVPRQSWYSGGDNLREVAYFADNSTRTRPVGKRKPNELLLYDMSGNVSEWVSDWFDTYPSYAQTNPQGPSSGTHKVVRGGNWTSSEMECRTTYREIYEPHISTTSIGFRVVRNF